MKLLLFILFLSLSALAGQSSVLYPEGEFFPIGGYSPVPSRDKAAGFTLAGPTYGDSRALLRECEEAGIDMVYRIRPSINVKKMQEPLTDEVLAEIRREVREEVASVASSSRIHSWTISPEELRYWRPRELAYFKAAIEEIRSEDPAKRPVWMYEPGHRTSKALAQLLPYMDISAKGMYINYAGRQEERSWTRVSTGAQAEAIRNANPKARLFALPEMFRQPPVGTEEEVAKWARHDCYSAILNGAEGILIFSFAKRKGFAARESYYDAYAKVARELNGEEKLGLALLKAGATSSSSRCKVLSGPAEITLPARLPSEQEHTLSSLTSRSCLWRGREYLFLVNSANATLSVSLPGSGWVDAGGVVQETPLSMAPWDVVILRRNPEPPQQKVND